MTNLYIDSLGYGEIHSAQCCSIFGEPRGPEGGPNLKPQICGGLSSIAESKPASWACLRCSDGKHIFWQEARQGLYDLQHKSAVYQYIKDCICIYRRNEIYLHKSDPAMTPARIVPCLCCVLLSTQKSNIGP